MRTHELCSVTIYTLECDNLSTPGLLYHFCTYAILFRTIALRVKTVTPSAQIVTPNQRKVCACYCGDAVTLSPCECSALATAAMLSP